jgi:Flp pilus assembly protein TadD
LELNPGFAECRVNLALLLNILGDRDGALEQTRLAVQVDPDSLEAWQVRSLLLANVGQGGDAVAASQEALRVNPYSALTHEHLAAVLATIGRADEARRHQDLARRLSGAQVRKARSP